MNKQFSTLGKKCYIIRICHQIRMWKGSYEKFLASENQALSVLFLLIMQQKIKIHIKDNKFYYYYNV